MTTWDVDHDMELVVPDAITEAIADAASPWSEALAAIRGE